MYEALSLQKVSLPTPIMAGVRTPSRQFSSCVLIEAGDSLDSISEASKAIIKYVSQRAGIGLNVGSIRALGSEIRGGEAVHTGLIPIPKVVSSIGKELQSRWSKRWSSYCILPIVALRSRVFTGT